MHTLEQMERRMEDGLDVELLEVNLGDTTLVERFVILRRRLGVTQAELAARAGRMQQSHVSAWERGNRRLSDDSVGRLVGALNAIAREVLEENLEAGSETTEQVA